jgi:hypothetical protein
MNWVTKVDGERDEVVAGRRLMSSMFSRISKPARDRSSTVMRIIAAREVDRERTA